MSTETIRSLTRGLDVLLAVQQEDGALLRDLHRRTGLAKPTLLRILATLEQRGFVRRGLEDGRFHTTHRLAPVRKRCSYLVAEIAAPEMGRLCRDVGWASDIAVYQGGKLEIVESSRRLTPHLVNRGLTGKRVDVLQSALGKAYLAFCPESDRRQIVAALQDSADPRDLIARDRSAVSGILGTTYDRGFGWRDDGYWAHGRALPFDLHALAVAVRGRDRTYAALNLLYPAAAFSQDEFAAKHLPRLQAAADRIGRDIDRTAPDSFSGS